MFYEFGTGTLVGRENIVKSFARFTADLHQKAFTIKIIHRGIFYLK